MAQHYKIDCDKVEDRKALVVVLSMTATPSTWERKSAAANLL